MMTSSRIIPVTSLHSGLSCPNVLILNKAEIGTGYVIHVHTAIDREVLFDVPLEDTYNSGFSDIFWSAVDIVESSSSTAVYSSLVFTSRVDNSVKALSFSGSGLSVVALISCW